MSECEDECRHSVREVGEWVGLSMYVSRCVRTSMCMRACVRVCGGRVCVDGDQAGDQGRRECVEEVQAGHSFQRKDKCEGGDGGDEGEDEGNGEG